MDIIALLYTHPTLFGSGNMFHWEMLLLYDLLDDCCHLSHVCFCRVVASRWMFHPQVWETTFQGHFSRIRGLKEKHSRTVNKIWGQTGKAGRELARRSHVHVCMWLDWWGVPAWITGCKDKFERRSLYSYTEIQAYQLNESVIHFPSL